MRVQDVGCTAAKLFPAETLGGMSFLQSVAGPLPLMKFCPTGGIDVERAQGYLQLPMCWRWEALGWHPMVLFGRIAWKIFAD